MKGCNKQFYYGTQNYPDRRCIDGNLWDDDDCDLDGNLYKPEEEIPCPFCRSDQYMTRDRIYLQSLVAK